MPEHSMFTSVALPRLWDVKQATCMTHQRLISTGRVWQPLATSMRVQMRFLLRLPARTQPPESPIHCQAVFQRRIGKCLQHLPRIGREYVGVERGRAGTVQRAGDMVMAA